MPLHPVTAHHRKHHKISGWLPTISSCERCQEAKANCVGKVVIKSRREADKAAVKHNTKVHWWPENCQLPYHCIWCGKWHLTTACREWQAGRVDKMFRKATRKSDKSSRGWRGSGNYEGPEAWDVR